MAHVKRDDAGFTRRGFLTGSGCLLTGAVLAAQQRPEPRRAGTAQRSPALSRLIDVHHHFVPPEYLKAMAMVNAGEAVRGWTPQRSLEKMDEHGMATAIMSIAQGVEAPDSSETPRVARLCNEYGARLVSDYSGRFGLFACLPLPDVAAGLKELEYALDTLHADGLGLMSHYGDAYYLGDPRFTPVFEEMNRRKVVVFVHPKGPFYGAAQSMVTLPGFGGPELPFDTTRTIGSVVSAGIPDKYPAIRFIFPHGGGTAPFLVGRAAATAAGEGYRQNLQKFTKVLASFYYDVANTMAAAPIKAVLEVAPPSHILFGTDIPYGGNGQYLGEMLDDFNKVGLANADLARVARQNVEALLPRFKGAS